VPLYAWAIIRRRSLRPIDQVVSGSASTLTHSGPRVTGFFSALLLLQHYGALTGCCFRRRRQSSSTSKRWRVRTCSDTCSCRGSTTSTGASNMKCDVLSASVHALPFQACTGNAGGGIQQNASCLGRHARAPRCSAESLARIIVFETLIDGCLYYFIRCE
jgi:hypothetical protein